MPRTSIPPTLKPHASIHPPPVHDERGHRGALVISALGVVFGDLGTSPLYTMQECLGSHGVAPERANVLGILSLIFWSLTMVVTVKYLMFLMRADNDGEGGIMALLALAPPKHKNPGPGRIGIIAMLVIAGAALLFGDGMITPAISVLAAVEGLKETPLKEAIIPITVAILLGLFAVQSHGTAKLGRLFGPVMLLWFVTIAALGIWHVLRFPTILEALSPVHAVRFFGQHGWGGVALLGGVVLCVTGGEALYADMGHFGAGPIRRAWLVICLPSLLLSYFGQGAMLLALPEGARGVAAEQPFYAMCPDKPWLYVFVFIGALATIIASQALISGVFSLTYQAIHLGFFPRLTVRHTSDEAEGQIYLPLMNWGLAVACVLLVLMFKESTKLAAAFGLAVSGTMAITSIVYYVVVRHTWGWPAWKALPILVVFLSFDIPFVVANSLKFVEGGYLPFLVGVFFVAIMVNWRIGRGLLGQYMAERSQPMANFLADLEQRVDTRSPGVGVYMASIGGVPPAMRRTVARFRSLHQTVVLLTVMLEHTPTIPEDRRILVGEELGKGFYQLTLRYGFMELIDVPADLAQVLPSMGIAIKPEETLYVLGRETFVASRKGRMGAAMETLFAFLSRNAKTATDYFGLPPDQVIEVGAQIDL
jgi:KUP system potassium uptake protein